MSVHSKGRIPMNRETYDKKTPKQKIKIFWRSANVAVCEALLVKMFYINKTLFRHFS